MSNRPDFRLVVSPKYDKQSNEKQVSTRIGAAWKIQKEGRTVGLNIKIDRAIPPFLISSDYDLTLWRNDDENRAAPRATTTPPPADEFGDDDIPF